jgi:hypothetical protein
MSLEDLGLPEHPSGEAAADAVGAVLGRDVRRFPAQLVVAGRAQLARRVRPDERLSSRRLDFRPLAPPPISAGVDLPDGFFALDFGFCAAFPDDEKSRAVAATATELLARHAPVVALDRFADHALRSAVVVRSRGFAGSYGPSAYLAALHGVPAAAFFTRRAGVASDDLAVAASALHHFAAIDASAGAEKAAARAASLLGLQTPALVESGPP